MLIYAHDKNADTSARWRDRGKFSESQPPPYEEGGWVPSQVGIFFPANYDYCLKVPIPYSLSEFLLPAPPLIVIEYLVLLITITPGVLLATEELGPMRKYP
jgi:hypothetical protein